MSITVTLPHLFMGEMRGGIPPQGWGQLSMDAKLSARLSFIEARARTLAELIYDPANGLPANIHSEAARLAATARDGLTALRKEDVVTAVWRAIDVGLHMGRINTLLAVAKALELTPKAQRDDLRQEGTKKERRPEITAWISEQLTRRPDAKSPELWAIAPEWLTDQIGQDRFSKRVTKARKNSF